MNQNLIETLLGAVVLVVAVLFVVMAGRTIGAEATSERYPLQAVFLDTGGLLAGNDVMINGIKVGVVGAVTLDSQTYDAVVHLRMNKEIQIPQDTQATIAVAGLLAEPYVRLLPGVDATMLQAGDTLQKTKDYVSLEDRIGTILFLATGQE